MSHSNAASGVGRRKRLPLEFLHFRLHEVMIWFVSGHEPRLGRRAVGPSGNPYRNVETSVAGGTACPTLEALPLALALSLVADLLLGRSACHTSGPFGLRRCLLARRALQLLAFCLVGNCLRIHQLLFSPAYFSISFLRPKRGKLTVILASSPSPSRRTTVPAPYLGCSTIMPARILRGAGGPIGPGGAAAGLAAPLTGAPIGPGGGGNFGAMGAGGRCGAAIGLLAALNGSPRSPKNCGMFSTEL